MIRPTKVGLVAYDTEHHEICMSTPAKDLVRVYHVHVYALSVARRHNRKAGRKAHKVVVRDGHFKVVPAIGCEWCDYSGFVDDPTACGDPDHCSPVVACQRCNPDGEDPE